MSNAIPTSSPSWVFAAEPLGEQDLLIESGSDNERQTQTDSV